MGFTIFCSSYVLLISYGLCLVHIGKGLRCKDKGLNVDLSA